MIEKPHYRLIVWQKSLELTKAIYDITKQLPGEERFGLTSQMRRASTSVACNIAEGAGRKSSAEKLHFFHIARGSLVELDTQIEICQILAYISLREREPIQQLVDDVGRLLYGLILSRQSRATLKPT